MSGNSLKIPTQVFRWFEKMKNHYDQNIQNVLEKFREQSEKQQIRIDKNQQNYINDLKKSHQQQLAQSQQIIDDLKNEINYFKGQLSLQQQSLERLNTRYDGVMTCLLKEQSKQNNIKDIFATDDFSTTNNNTMMVENEHIPKEENTTPEPPQKENTVILESSTETANNKTVELTSDEIVEQALLYRQSGETKKAFTLFLQAAELEHVKAMAAVGRSYFLAEGVEENHIQGLTWLIKAANKDHLAAKKRVQYFQENEPDLYHQAQTVLLNKNTAEKNN